MTLVFRVFPNFPHWLPIFNKCHGSSEYDSQATQALVIVFPFRSPYITEIAILISMRIGNDCLEIYR